MILELRFASAVTIRRFLQVRKSPIGDRKLKLAARVGLAPTPCGLTNRRATLTPPGNGAAGRISTCIVPFRRRMPHVFGHGSLSKLVSAAGFAPAIPRSQAECVGCYAT